MWLGKLVRGYLLMAAARLMSTAPRQEVLNTSLPSMCTSPLVLPHLDTIPPTAWRTAFATQPTSSIIDISIPLHAGTVDWERCASTVVAATAANPPCGCSTQCHWPRAVVSHAGCVAAACRPLHSILPAHVCTHWFGLLISPLNYHDSHHACTTGTHIDSPGHFIWDAYASGQGMESLSLHILNGAGRDHHRHVVILIMTDGNVYDVVVYAHRPSTAA